MSMVGGLKGELPCYFASVKGEPSSAQAQGCVPSMGLGPERTPMWTAHCVPDLPVHGAPGICFSQLSPSIPRCLRAPFPHPYWGGDATPPLGRDLRSGQPRACPTSLWTPWLGTPGLLRGLTRH